MSGKNHEKIQSLYHFLDHVYNIGSIIRKFQITGLKDLFFILHGHYSDIGILQGQFK